MSYGFDQFMCDANNSDHWPVDYPDVRGSFELAMRTAGVDEAVIAEVVGTVDDYVTNEYGDL